jgi:hypothetical protein
MFRGVIDPALPEDVGVLGCVYGHHWSYWLGEVASYTAHGGGGIEREKLFGALVEYEEVLEEGGQNYSRREHAIVVRNLRNGRVIHRVATITPDTEGPKAIAIVVKASDGATAWSVAPRFEEVDGTWVPSFYEIHVVDRSGSRVVADGREVEPSSLRIRGSTLYWTMGGEPMSATLH